MSGKIFHVQEMRRAKDPNNGTLVMDLWIVWAFEEGKGPYQVAYCPRQADAERIAELLNEARAAKAK